MAHDVSHDRHQAVTSSCGAAHEVCIQDEDVVEARKVLAQLQDECQRTEINWLLYARASVCISASQISDTFWDLLEDIIEPCFGF